MQAKQNTCLGGRDTGCRAQQGTGVSRKRGHKAQDRSMKEEDWEGSMHNPETASQQDNPRACKTPVVGSLARATACTAVRLQARAVSRKPELFMPVNLTSSARSCMPNRPLGQLGDIMSFNCACCIHAHYGHQCIHAALNKPHAPHMLHACAWASVHASVHACSMSNDDDACSIKLNTPMLHTPTIPTHMHCAATPPHAVPPGPAPQNKPHPS